MSVEIKDIIQTYREKMGLTMKELSQKVGASEETISRWKSEEYRKYAP
ncbi:helix-turn-helix domain-containing protein [Pseudoramibacter alactolyticus]|jgi:ribosome-binding protein aMBF1 (putative translation factor)